MLGFRLLPLLLVIVLSVIGVNAVHGSSLTKPFIIRKTNPALQIGGRFEKRYQLASRCREYVLIKRGRKVKATGKKDSQFTHLMFDSLPNGYISIRGVHRHQYICFSNKGKLVLRRRETDSCVFKEVLAGGYTEFQSAKNPAWFIGFNKKGRPLRGYNIGRRKRRNCFQFVKTAVMPRPSTTNWSPISGPERLKNAMNKNKARRRRKG